MTEASFYTGDIGQLAVKIHDWSRGKGFWKKPRNDGEALMLVTSELAEALEFLRMGNPPSDKIPEFSGAEEECADAIIRILDLAEGRGWRIQEALAAKMLYNEGRPELHGKLF